MTPNPIEDLIGAIRTFVFVSGDGKAPPQIRDQVIAALAVYDYAGELDEHRSQAQATIDLFSQDTPNPLAEDYELAVKRIKSNELGLSELTEANIAARKVIEDLRRQLAEANDALADMEGRVDEFAELDRRARATIVELERTIGRLSQQTTHVPEGFELVPEARASAYRAVAIMAERVMRSGLQSNLLIALQGALDALDETLDPRDDA